MFGSNSFGSAAFGQLLIVSVSVNVDKTGLSRIRASTNRNQLALARLLATVTDDQLGVTRLKKTLTPSLTGTSLLTGRGNKNLDGIGCIKNTTIQPNLGLSRLSKTVVPSLTSQSRVKTTVPQTKTGVSKIRGLIPKDLSGVSRVRVHVSSLDTYSNINIGSAALGQFYLILTQLDQPGTSRIKAILTVTKDGIARLKKTVTQTITGVARLTNSTGLTASQSGISRIRVTVLDNLVVCVGNIGSLSLGQPYLYLNTNNVKGVSRVKAINISDRIGVSKIVVIGTAHSDINGLAWIDKSKRSFQSGKSWIYKFVVRRTIHGRSKIKKPATIFKFTQRIKGRARITKA